MTLILFPGFFGDLLAPLGQSVAAEYRPYVVRTNGHFLIRSPSFIFGAPMFKVTDPATRELLTGCIPAALVLTAVAAGLVTVLWWWLSK